MSKRSRSLSVTDAARGFADLVNRAFYRNETTVLLKNGAPVAHIAPVAPAGITASELAVRWAAIPHLTPSDADAFARVITSGRDSLPAPKDKWR